VNPLLVPGIALAVLLAGSAKAADMPIKVPTYRPASPEVFSWSGFYIGGHLGYGSSSNEWVIVDPAVTPFGIGSATINGALGGVQVGVNWQTGPVVLGVEADFSWADMSGETCGLAIGTGSFLCLSKVERFGTIAGRIGGAFDRTLLYLKAGGAWVHDTQTESFIGPGVQQPFTASKSKWGWTAGAGVEYALTRNWSAKVEYDFLLFDTEPYLLTFAQNGISATTTADIKQRIHTVKLGFNYRFDWGSPVAAKY
jgi:outer membrane immunogenic protein